MKKKFLISLLFSSLSAQAAEVIGGLDIPNLATPECMEIKYSPVVIHSSPNKSIIGSLVLDKPEMAATYQPSCNSRPVIQTKINNKVNKLDTIEISYEHAVPAVYEIKNNWLKLKNKYRFVWVKKESSWKYVSYEQDLAQGIEVVKEFCTKKQCHTLPKETQALIKSNEVGSCYGNIYEISGKIIKMPDGRKVYPARMLEELLPLYKKQLPVNTYIPVYSKNGKWNGFYYSRGC